MVLEDYGHKEVSLEELMGVIKKIENPKDPGGLNKLKDTSVYSSFVYIYNSKKQESEQAT